MNYRDMLASLKTNCITQLARRSSWVDLTDKVAYVPELGTLEKRENGKWIPYYVNEEDGTATDWELTSPYV